MAISSSSLYLSLPLSPLFEKWDVSSFWNLQSAVCKAVGGQDGAGEE